MIISFSGEYAFLSNFWPWRGQEFIGPPIVIEYEGIMYPSVEHAFQAAKIFSRGTRVEISKLTTPGQAKRAGRSLQLRPDWDSVRIPVMEKLLREKFLADNKQSEALLLKLLDTVGDPLVEGNTWNDSFWGKVLVDGRYVGENNLGMLLMKIRREAFRR